MQIKKQWINAGEFSNYLDCAFNALIVLDMPLSTEPAEYQRNRDRLVNACRILVDNHIKAGRERAAVFGHENLFRYKALRAQVETNHPLLAKVIRFQRIQIKG